MRVVTAGIGLRAGHVLTTLKEEMPEAEIVGYYDPQPTHLDMIGTDTPRYDSVEAMLSDAKPDLYCVFSPNVFHLDQIRLGLEAGVQVFTEKPVVDLASRKPWNSPAFWRCTAASTAAMVGLVLRYSQHMVDLRAALAQGQLGQVVSLEANEHIGPYHGAFFMRDWRRRDDLCRRLHAGKMLPRHRHLQHGHRLAPRSAWPASAGANRFLPENAPASNAEAEIFHVKKSVWEQTDDPFHSDGDIIDYQTAILQYETGASLAFHTNLNVPDEHRRFCVIGTHGMAEGDFVRGYLKITARDGTPPGRPRLYPGRRRQGRALRRRRDDVRRHRQVSARPVRQPARLDPRRDGGRHRRHRRWIRPAPPVRSST